MTTIVVAAGIAAAQPTNAERANALNDEGKDLMEQQRFADASERFRQATLLSQEGRFYFNLCVSLFHEGKFGLSLQACQAVENAGADAKLKEKTNRMIGKVKEEIRKLGIDPDKPMQPDPNDPNNTPPDPNDPNNTPPDPNDPNNTPPDPNDPNNTPPNPNVNPQANQIVGTPPPTASLFQAVAPDHHYTWTLGAEIFGGSAKWGGDEFYGTNAYGFRVVGDYLAMPKRKVGFQAWLGVVHSDANDNDMRDKIDTIDVGIGAYKHLCRNRLCFTPLLGVELALLQPGVLESSSEALIAFGARIEGRLGYAFGPRFEHLLSLAVGPQIYTGGVGEVAGATPSSLGLDAPSLAFLVGVGYTYRFNTPFGSSPFVTLE